MLPVIGVAKNDNCSRQMEAGNNVLHLATSRISDSAAVNAGPSRSTHLNCS